MKSKKLFLPALILIVAVLLMAVACVVLSVAQKPTVTEAQFPFSITYEYHGKQVTIEDVYTAYYAYNDGYADTKHRVYEGKIGNFETVDVTDYTIEETERSRLILSTNFHPDYMMGDTDYDHYEFQPFAPSFTYYGSDGYTATEPEELEAMGAKIIDFQYPEPIENTLVFSHISILSGETVVGPTVLISLLALLAVILFVKKDDTLVPVPLDTVSFILNLVIGFVATPFLGLVSTLSDISGDNDNILSQTMYFTAALTVLGIAASVALRRKGYSKTAFVVQFAGPALFVLIMVAGFAAGML